MSKSKNKNQAEGAAASRSESALKTLDSETRFIDDLIPNCPSDGLQNYYSAQHRVTLKGLIC
jgi:hypothetical protein